MALFKELKRRNVFRVAIAYLALAWLLTEVAGTLFPVFGIPDWGVRFMVIVFALGFVPALIISWVYELTPEGIKREKEVERDASITHITSKKLDVFTIGLIVVALVFILADRLWLSPRLAEQLAAPAEVVTEVVQTSEPEPTEPQYPSNSIAVLPFANRSANPDDAFFVDGIHDDLLTHISRIGSIKTISRTSVMQYRDTAKPIPQIAAELGVGTVLEGGVQRAGEQVRINVQLINARTDEHLWAEIYDRQLTATNIFAIQSEIARSIADALRANLTTEARERFASIPTENLEALEAYFLGRQSMATRTISDLANAAGFFEDAVTLDPDFALAWAGLADIYLLHWAYFGPGTEAEAIANSRAAAERALLIDPGLGEVYASEGVRRNWEGDREGAEAAFRKALQLNPNYATAYAWYGDLLHDWNGRIDEALELFRQAVALDPNSAIIVSDYGKVLAYAGRLNEALAKHQKAIGINPNLTTAIVQKGFLYWHGFGRIDKAVDSYLEVVSIEPNAYHSMRLAAMAYLDLGDDEQADYWLRRALELRLDEASHNYSALLHLYRGEDSLAMEYAEKGLEEGERSNLHWWMMLALLSDHDMKAGDHTRARVRYEKSYPELLYETGPEIDRRNLRAAIGLAAVLLNSGEVEKADRLLDRCLSVISKLPRAGTFGYGALNVQIHALRGEKGRALAELRQAVDQGWRGYWWFYFEHDPNLQVLRDEPAFKAIKQEIEADMAEQLALVRKWGTSGDQPPEPGT